MNSNESAAAATISGESPPENGLRGLKHWRHDLVAGMIVSLVSLPLCLGIAIASGAPPIAGLISAIIAGLVYPCMGGAYVTISGPAAGLAPALIASMFALGGGSLEAGYPRLLAVISVTGLMQLLLTTKLVAKKFPVTQLAAMLPRSVVKGMVAAIGLSVIGKQIPHLLGAAFRQHHFFAVLAELPSKTLMFNGQALTVAAVCTATMFALHGFSRRWKQLGAIPPQLIVVLLGICLGRVLGVGPSFLIHIPDDLFGHGNVLQGFKALLTGGATLRLIGVQCFVLILFVDAVESLATIGAVDDMDPFRRKSDPTKTLRAMGACNLISSLLGGLTIIPNVIPSSVCIMQGGRTINANFFNACCLILYAVFLRQWINLIPFAALAAILIHIGWNLCKPAVWFSIARVSKAEFLAFATTVVLALQLDLLWGIVAGTVVHYCLVLWAVHKHPSSGSIVESAARLFRNPIAESVTVQGADRTEIKIHGPLTCFNIRHLIDDLRRIPEEIQEICLVGHLVPVMDCNAAHDLWRYRQDNNDRRVLAIHGLDLEGRLLSSGSDH